MEETSNGHLTRMEFDAITIEGIGSETGRVRGRAAPYGVSNGRRYSVWRIDAQGFPERVEAAGRIWEPGAFNEWLSNGGRERVRFLWQHGDAAESWGGTPIGINSLPIGTIRDIDAQQADGVYFAADFASHELAQAVRELVSTGAIRELSIGSVTHDFELREHDDGQLYIHATRADLFDISAVVWGQHGLQAAITDFETLAPISFERFQLDEQRRREDRIIQELNGDETVTAPESAPVSTPSNDSVESNELDSALIAARLREQTAQEFIITKGLSQ